ncbi:MAG: hypothetical protein IT376_05840 [Polyangiaceae bacterium]|nr:hypothetical protein [Polyangiaceae bacterium]
MYFIALPRPPDVRELEQHLARWRPDLRFTYTRSTRIERNRQTGQMTTTVQEVLWASTDRLTGAKVFVQSGHIYVGAAVRQLGLSGFFQFMLGSGASARQQLARDVALFLAWLTGGSARNRHGAVS